MKATVKLWLRLFRLLPLWVWLATPFDLPQTTFAYDYDQAQVSYDGTKTALGYDQYAVHTREESGGCSIGEYPLFADFTKFLAAEGTAQLPAKLYHYTGEGNVCSILENGLGAGGRRTFATPVGNLSPVQAQIELALPANRGYPGALFEIDTARLQQLGINPAVGPQRIMSTPNAGGGGIEYIFNQPIPPSAIRQVPFP